MRCETQGGRRGRRPAAWQLGGCLREAMPWVRRHLERRAWHPWGQWLFREAGRAQEEVERLLKKPGGYRFEPVRMRWIRSVGAEMECWEARDAWLLKALALLLTPFFEACLSIRCYHLRGRGGSKAAVRALRKALASGKYRFVARSDARGYYANIHHTRLLELCRRRLDCPVILHLIAQFCERTVVSRGCYRRVDKKGIPLGSPLSPLMGALYLSPLDERLTGLPGVYYARFMDDWVILAESRWKLRRAVRVMNATLGELELEQHPDKTFIGRVEKGFDFLGYDFSADGGLVPSWRTRRRLAENIARLYEQGADVQRLERYLEKWLIWLRAGLADPARTTTGETARAGRPQLTMSRMRAYTPGPWPVTIRPEKAPLSGARRLPPRYVRPPGSCRC